MPDDAEGGRQLVLRCAWCDRIRDDDGAWRVVGHEYLEGMEGANRLTHGMCPQCFAELTGGDELPDAVAQEG